MRMPNFAKTVIWGDLDPTSQEFSEGQKFKGTADFRFSLFL
jgi:hypothetical protein